MPFVIFHFALASAGLVAIGLGVYLLVDAFIERKQVIEEADDRSLKYIRHCRYYLTRDHRSRRASGLRGWR